MTVQVNFTTSMRALVLATALTAAAPAPAQDTGFYAGGALGQAKAKDACSGITGIGFSGGCDDKDTAWKIFGGYQFNPNLGVELGYVDLGDFTANGTVLGAPVSASAEAKGFELVGVGSIPFTQQLSGYAKAGAFRWDVDTRTAAGATATGGGDKGTDFTYGLGLKYDFTRNIAGRLEFQRYNNVGETSTTGQSDVNLWTAGVMFKF
jgi:OOP family OmpA-OmpF porin